MASTGAVWGIDIGQCALKALRCRPHEKDTNRVVVEAFDYVEYPKILSQPDADREELIREALETFLSRNEVKGDRVAISVPGQSGLARFIKLPPVESKKIPDIVKYEARQQIPFALEDVVWDYQALEGGSQDDGYALETEVGLFAMKRDQVARALEPLESAGVEVEVIQLSPLAVYNYVCFDRLNNMEDAQPFDPDNPAPSKVVLSFGADTTDIVITNGYRVWQRNIPIGGSHFTKALTKELKLTFAKAEHLKKNAKQAEDPKAVFKAMRPVFSDLAAEIQRSLTFFMSNNKTADLQEIIALGNPMKLPGLARFLTQNLDQEVKAIDDFPALVGGSITATPQFEDNKLAFATAYGLCVQALGAAKLSTNLLPDEIVTSRLIRSKKPWAVAAAALLMVGMTVNYWSHTSALNQVNVENSETWKPAINQSKNLNQTSSGLVSDNSALKEQFVTLKTIGDNLQSNADGRLLWLELYKAIDTAIPKDTRPDDLRQPTVADVTNREELHITNVEVQHFPEAAGGLATWFQGPVAAIYNDARVSFEEYAKAREVEEEAEKIAEATNDGAAPPPGAEPPGADQPNPDALPPEDNLAQDPGGAPAGDPMASDPMGADPYGQGGDGMAGDGTAEGGAVGPTGPGYVIELTGHHFHNSNPDEEGVTVTMEDESLSFVRKTLIKNLLEASVTLPDVEGNPVEVPLSKLGISYPVIVTKPGIRDVWYNPEATTEDQASGARPSLGEQPDLFGDKKDTPDDLVPRDPREDYWKLRQYNFKVQFVWQPTPRHEREKLEEEGSGAEGLDSAAQLNDPNARF